MEWVIAGAALLIVAAFVFGAMRSARAPRPQPQAGRRDDRTDGGGGGGDGGT